MDDRAFVICQVGDEGSTIRARADEVYEYVVTPVVETLGLAVMRSDRDPTPGQITSQIIRSLTSAKVVIADLSGQNANVYYELGVAHSFGLPVVVLVDSIGSLSFDTSHERVIELGTGGKLGVAEADNAKARLKAALEVVLADGYKPASLSRRQPALAVSKNSHPTIPSWTSCEASARGSSSLSAGPQPRRKVGCRATAPLYSSSLVNLSRRPVSGLTSSRIS